MFAFQYIRPIPAGPLCFCDASLPLREFPPEVRKKTRLRYSIRQLAEKYAREMPQPATFATGGR